MKQFLLAIAWSLAASAWAFSPNRIEVSTTSELASAREAVKAFFANDPEPGPVDIILAPGTYRLTPEARVLRGKDDPGTERSPVRYVSRDADNPAVLTSAKEIPTNLFTAWKDGILVADLSSGYFPARTKDHNLVPDYATVTNSTFMPARLPVVFVDDERYSTANWPNEGWAQFAHKDIVEKSVTNGIPTGAMGTFSYADNKVDNHRPERWVNEPYVYLHGYFNWDYQDGISAVSINTNNATMTFLKKPAAGLGAGTQAQPHRWRAVHLLSELDAPGEYYFDLDTYRLYLMPKQPFTDATRVEITCEPDVLVLLNKAHDVVFEDLVFSKGITAVGGGSSTNVVFRNVRFEHLRCDTVNIAALAQIGGSRISVEGCTFTDIGGGGVRLTPSGDHRLLIPSANTVADCSFLSCNQLTRTAAPPLGLGGVGDIIEHNLFRDTPSHAICASGCNDVIFRYNLMTNCCTEADDAASFYKGQNPSACGNILEHNYFVDCGRNGPMGTMAVYFDDGDCGDTVRNCLFLRCGSPKRASARHSYGALNIGGGYGFTLKKNVFMDCPAGSRTATDETDPEGWWARHVARAEIVEAATVVGGMGTELYNTHYPWSVGFFDPLPEAQRTNYFDNCTYINVPVPLYGRAVCRDNCRFLDADDGTRPLNIEKVGPRPLAWRVDPTLAGPAITYYIAPADTALDAQDAEGCGLSPEKPFRTLAYARALMDGDSTSVEDAVAFVLLKGTHTLTVRHRLQHPPRRNGRSRGHDSLLRELGGRGAHHARHTPLQPHRDRRRLHGGTARRQRSPGQAPVRLHFQLRIPGECRACATPRRRGPDQHVRVRRQRRTSPEQLHPRNRIRHRGAG